MKEKHTLIKTIESKAKRDRIRSVIINSMARRKKIINTLDLNLIWTLKKTNALGREVLLSHESIERYKEMSEQERKLMKQIFNVT